MVMTKEYPDNHNYIIYSDGRVYSKNINDFMKPKLDEKGYYSIVLSVNGEKHYWRLHKLVATMFIPNPNHWEQINHLDENPKNNDVSNLEWSTPYLNSNYGTRNKRIGITLAVPILMLDKETKQPLKRFGSIADAERWLTKKDGRGNIIAALKGRRPYAYGFCWKYVE